MSMERKIDLLVQSSVIFPFLIRIIHFRVIGHRKHRGRYRRTPHSLALTFLPAQPGWIFSHTLSISQWFCHFWNIFRNFWPWSFFLTCAGHSMIFQFLKLYSQLWPRVPPDKRPIRFLHGLVTGRYMTAWTFGQLVPTIFEMVGIDPLCIAHAIFRLPSGIIWFLGDDVTTVCSEIINFPVSVLSKLWYDRGLIMDPIGLFFYA